MTMTASVDRIRLLFSDERRFWPRLAVVLGAVSLMKGLQRPNRWAATQALINYDDGLVKRGLFGTIFDKALHLDRYAHFAAFSFVLLMALAAMLVALTVQRGAVRMFGAGEPVAIFFGSFAVTYLAHLVGYLDIPLAILTLGLLMIRNTSLRFAAALPACIAAVLIHEMFFLVFLPVVLFSFVVDGLSETGERRRQIWIMTAALAGVCLGLVIKLALLAPLLPEQAAAMQREIAQRADFLVRPDFFRVLQFSSLDNMRGMWRYQYRSFHYWGSFLVNFVVLAPTIFLLLYGARRAIQKTIPLGLRRLATAGALVAGLAPIGLHLVAWDTERFNALACLDCFLVLLLVSPKRSEAAVALPGWYRNAAVLTLALSMASGEGLMDYLAVNPYPFSEGFKMLLHRMVRHDWQSPAS